MPGPKEDVYDNEIAPLMSEIIKICKANNINMAAQFSLDPVEGSTEPLYCTTVLPNVDTEDTEGMARMMKLRSVMYPPNPYFAAFTIISSPVDK